MTRYSETLVKVLERSIEIYCSDSFSLEWFRFEIEGNRHLLSNPRTGSIRGSWLFINGFTNRNAAEKCATWLIELLEKNGWEENPKRNKPANERWYKKTED